MKYYFNSRILNSFELSVFRKWMHTIKKGKNRKEWKKDAINQDYIYLWDMTCFPLPL